MQPFKNIQVNGWAALPNIFCHGPAHFASLKNLVVLMLCRLSTAFKSTAGCAPPNTVQLISRCSRYFCLDGMKFIKNMQIDGWAELPKTRPSLYHAVESLFRLEVLQPIKNSQVDFRFDVLQIFNSVQMNGWSCSPKHGPAQPTVLSQLFVRMVWSFSKTFKSWAGSYYLKHGPVPFTVFKNLFVWMLCSHLETFKLMAGPRSPTSPVTTQLISQR